MQPYQEASEAINRQSAAPINALKTGASLALSAGSFGGGGAVLSRILPFLNKLIAPSTAVKGISKIAPRVGKGIEAALKLGYSFEDVSDYLKNNIDSELNPTESFQEAPERQGSELSRESLQQQFDQSQQQNQGVSQGQQMQPQGQGQGKSALGPILAESIQMLRSLKRGG